MNKVTVIISGEKFEINAKTKKMMDEKLGYIVAYENEGYNPREFVVMFETDLNKTKEEYHEYFKNFYSEKKAHSIAKEIGKQFGLEVRLLS